MRTGLSPLRVIRSGLCIGCGGCVASSNAGDGRMDFDRYGQLRPFGEAAWLNSKSSVLAKSCPFSPEADNEDQLAELLFPGAPRHKTVGRFLSAYVGYVAEKGFRGRGSSGGLTSWVIEELLLSGRIDGVAHVAPAEDPEEEGRLFHYRISRTPDEIREGAKSRYYPVELSGVLREIRQMPGRYAVVGVPCFIKAIQLLRQSDPILQKRITHTLGLFCGHMKTSRFIESFAVQMGIDPKDIHAAEYRLKDPARPASTYTAEITTSSGQTQKRDWWNLVDGDWGAGFFQYSACNYCDDVIAEVADISFGDAWVEPYASDGRGTNVVVVRSEELRELIVCGIRRGRLRMQEVDEGFVVKTQAAGIRQRREGLAYRLTWPKSGLRPRKRVGLGGSISEKRRLIYRTRAFISYWSHRAFWLALLTKRPMLYTRWAAAVASFYHGLAYSRGRWGKVLDFLLKSQ